MTVFSTADILALGWFVLAWLGYNVIVEMSPLRRKTLSYAMEAYRRGWMATMSRRSVRIMDVGIVGGLQQGTAFFASTSMIAIGGGFALLNSTERILAIAEHLGMQPGSAVALWEVKALGLMLIFAYAFFKFGWAYRLFNYSTIVMGATPEQAQDTAAFADEVAARAAELMVLAGRHFNRGQRAFFFSIGYLGWFVDPRIFAATTLATLIVLVRRQFFSRARALCASGLSQQLVPAEKTGGTNTETGAAKPLTS